MFNLKFMSAEVLKSLQLSYLFMVSSATGLWVCGLPNGWLSPLESGKDGGVDVYSKKNSRSHFPESTQLLTEGDDFGISSQRLAQSINRIVEVRISFYSRIARQTVVGFDILESFDIPAGG